MTQHTPEPWYFDKYQNIIAGSDTLLLGGICTPMTSDSRMEEGKANARRIVACVNAMAGIADDNAIFAPGNSVRKVISNMAIKQADTERRAADLQAQVDELLAITERLVQWDIEYPVNCDNGYAGLKALDDIILDSKIAIKKITGEPK